MKRRESSIESSTSGFVLKIYDRVYYRVTTADNLVRGGIEVCRRSPKRWEFRSVECHFRWMAEWMIMLTKYALWNYNDNQAGENTLVFMKTGSYSKLCNILLSSCHTFCWSNNSWSWSLPSCTFKLSLIIIILTLKKKSIE